MIALLGTAFQYAAFTWGNGHHVFYRVTGGYGITFGTQSADVTDPFVEITDESGTIDLTNVSASGQEGPQGEQGDPGTDGRSVRLDVSYASELGTEVAGTEETQSTTVSGTLAGAVGNNEVQHITPTGTRSNVFTPAESASFTIELDADFDSGVEIGPTETENTETDLINTSQEVIDHRARIFRIEVVFSDPADNVTFDAEPLDMIVTYNQTTTSGFALANELRNGYIGGVGGTGLLLPHSIYRFVNLD